MVIDIHDVRNIVTVVVQIPNGTLLKWVNSHQNYLESRKQNRSL